MGQELSWRNSPACSCMNPSFSQNVSGSGHHTASIFISSWSCVKIFPVKSIPHACRSNPPAMATMQPFTLTLSDGAVVTGLFNLPALTATAPRYRPLLIGLHGGSYSSHYFDVDASHTASLASNAHSVPFVAIDRPGYKGSTSFTPIPEGTTYHEVTADRLHDFILPALWEKYGQGCTGIALLCHSLGAPGAVIAAAAHAEEAEAGSPHNYPLLGLIISGFGTMPHDPEFTFLNREPRPEFINFPPPAKDAIMMPPGTADPNVYKYTEELDQPCTFDEVADAKRVWLPRWRAEWGSKVTAAVMIGIAELDGLWVGTQEHARDFAEGFGKSIRVEAGVVSGAPHNLEMSYWAQGWYARCFGFALECAAAAGAEKTSL